MDLKYRRYSANDYNFVQRNGGMSELTVEITLDEYRSLITDVASMSLQIDDLNAELKKLTEKIEALQKAVAATIPPSLIKGLAGWASQFCGADEAEDAEDQEESDE